MYWEAQSGRTLYHYWILAESMERARALFAEVCRWDAQVHEEVLVFDSGKDAQELHRWSELYTGVSRRRQEEITRRVYDLIRQRGLR
jgi:hypothetical protein